MWVCAQSSTINLSHTKINLLLYLRAAVDGARDLGTTLRLRRGGWCPCQKRQRTKTVNGVCDGRRRQPRLTSLPHRIIMKSDAARRMAAALCEEREARTCRLPKKTNKNSKRHAQITIIKFIHICYASPLPPYTLRPMPTTWRTTISFTSRYCHRTASQVHTIPHAYAREKYT